LKQLDQGIVIYAISTGQTTFDKEASHITQPKKAGAFVNQNANANFPQNFLSTMRSSKQLSVNRPQRSHAQQHDYTSYTDTCQPFVEKSGRNSLKIEQHYLNKPFSSSIFKSNFQESFIINRLRPFGEFVIYYI
jgi:hypothetical protein